MAEKNISQWFRVKNIEETRNYFYEEIEQNALNYIERSLTLASAVAGCISISAFVSLFDIPVGITGSTIGLKFCMITAGIKKFKSIINKKKKKHVKIVFLAKSKLKII